MNEGALKRAAAYIEQWLGYHYERGETPGFAVAIAHKGKMIMNHGYGFADTEQKILMTKDHLFRIASHSKTFTATAVMQLQEQRKLRIDDYVCDHLPWLRQHKDEKWQKVTIRQLLSHGAGVIRDGNNSDYWNLYRPFPDTGEFRKEILEADLVIENNIKLKYSNYGYTLLGLLIAEVSGVSYNDFVTQNIVNALGLKNTGPEYDAQHAGEYVTSYTRLNNKKKRLPINPVDTKVMSSATGFYSNAEDLCAYFSAHMTGSGKLLDDESKKEMQRPQWHAENTRHKVDYGLGLDVEYVNDRTLIGHGGGFPGNITKSLSDPKDELVVIVLTNANGSSAGYWNHNIIRVIDFFQKHKDSPKWQKYEGRYSDLWHDLDIIAADDKLFVAGSGDWEPFDKPEELEHVKANIFRVTKTDSFSSVDELVVFNLDTAGKTESISYCGATMVPENTYIRQMAGKKRVG
jgi:D-alanyl-D-alanine carboxypeptidase